MFFLLKAAFAGQNTVFLLSSLYLPESYYPLCFSEAGENVNLAFFILMLPVRIFFFAQEAKRCHDGISGWFQHSLMPLYLIFGSGDQGPNKYGDDPKLQTKLLIMWVK